MVKRDRLADGTDVAEQGAGADMAFELETRESPEELLTRGERGNGDVSRPRLQQYPFDDPGKLDVVGEIWLQATSLQRHQ